jgi:hypothetical protein
MSLSDEEVELLETRMAQTATGETRWVRKVVGTALFIVLLYSLYTFH